VFHSCSNLLRIEIPNSVASIEDAAFRGCASLTNVTIGNSVTNIGVLAFYQCSQLTEVTIPNSVISIGNEAFHDCASLTNVVIGSSVTNIGNSAFYACTSLNSIILPGGVSYIGDYAFSFCTKLTAVYFRGNAPSFGTWVFAFNTNGNPQTVYYLQGTTNCGVTFGSRPTALWLPKLEASAANFGAQANQFGFNISWASGMVVAVDACTDLANPVWSPLQTNTLTSDMFCFSDPAWTNSFARCYRVRSP
jgi:hypothetical protein